MKCQDQGCERGHCKNCGEHMIAAPNGQLCSECVDIENEQREIAHSLDNQHRPFPDSASVLAPQTWLKRFGKAK